jgi:phosphoribosyl-dephospho-CoA transferase
MKDISKPQITAIQTALRAQQLQEQKQQLVLQYTGQENYAD